MAKKPPTNPKVAAALAALRKRVGKERAHLLGDPSPTTSDVTDVLPTGIDVLDHHLIGVGGLPAGRVIEIFGAESTGKTTTAVEILSAGQRAGGLTFLSESERALDSNRCATLGCDLGQVIIDHPECLEDALDWLEQVFRSLPDYVRGKGNPPPVVAFDSIAASASKREIDEGISGGDKMGEKAKIMSAAMRVLTPQVQRTGAILVLLNQTRKALGAFGMDVTTPGGEAVKFHASVRLWLLGGKAVKKGKGGRHVGKIVTAIAIKNKLVPPWRKARIYLEYATGWETVWSTLDHAKTEGLIEPRSRPARGTYEAALKALGWPASTNARFASEDAEESEEDPEDAKPLVDGEDD